MTDIASLIKYNLIKLRTQMLIMNIEILITKKVTENSLKEKFI